MSKKFDAVAWMRKRRAEIEEDDAGLTWDQRTRKTTDLLKADPLWQHVKDRVVDPAALVHNGQRIKLSR